MVTNKHIKTNLLKHGYQLTYQNEFTKTWLPINISKRIY